MVAHLHHEVLALVAGVDQPLERPAELELRAAVAASGLEVVDAVRQRTLRDRVEVGLVRVQPAVSQRAGLAGWVGAFSRRESERAREREAADLLLCLPTRGRSPGTRAGPRPRR